MSENMNNSENIDNTVVKSLCCDVQITREYVDIESDAESNIDEMVNTCFSS